MKGVGIKCEITKRVNFRDKKEIAGVFIKESKSTTRKVPGFSLKILDKKVFFCFFIQNETRFIFCIDKFRAPK